FTPARLALLTVTPIAGAVIFGAVFVATATVAFWWIESGEIANGLTYGGLNFTQYPITIYGALFRRLFAYAVGFAFVAYYPAHAHGRRRRRNRSHRTARGDGGLHRPERRRQVDDPEDAHRRSLPVRGAGEGLRSRAGASTHAAGPTHRRRLRAALAALVGSATAGLVRTAAPRLRGAGHGARRPASPLPAATRSRRLPRCPSPPALARPADAGRAHGGTPARARGAVPRRADDRARPGEQAGCARVPRRAGRRRRS